VISIFLWDFVDSFLLFGFFQILNLLFKSFSAVQITQLTLKDVEIIMKHAFWKFYLIFRRLSSRNFNVFVKLSQHCTVKILRHNLFSTLGGIPGEIGQNLLTLVT